MLFTQNRDQLRSFYCQAWGKYRTNKNLQSMEQLIGDVVSLHPEYHTLLENEDKALQKDFLPEFGESNPFLHMSMHLAIREQLSSGQPAGIVKIHQTLLARHTDPHHVEHLMMECLASALWSAQKEGTPPNDADYLSCLKRHINQ